ncbi:SET and MYND domain-containing protein 4-like [Anthonomus grandis grandis]|uniref:SET and MYND domain-containing protein 4-like n=1 Tax=Anthonomus grandis grandis TaxID=2921223 RepID=UPI0021664533|nr:SET and MYND domain-containing protein 4-like [Anthonomus grandis grandis]
MKTNITDFQKYCEKAIGKLSNDCIESFREAKDDITRIKLMYDVAQQIPLGSGSSDKDVKLAEEKKNEGNRFFAKKEYGDAIKCYNHGIIYCPQETIQDRELLTILVSNRSATNFELEKYRRVLDDLDYISEIGDYPKHLKYKLWLRKAKCYDALGNINLAAEAYAESLKTLRQSNLKEDALQSKIKEIEKAKIDNKKGNQKKAKEYQELIPAFTEERFVAGSEFVAANPKITVAQDSYQGRYAKAVEDIEAGTILVEEPAFSSVVDKDHALVNCQNCLTSVELPIACPGCADVIFCSTHCSRMATKSFHAVECGFQRNLFDSGASVNCLLALRIISQKPVQFFLDKRNKLKDFLKDSCKKNVVRKKIYRSDDYDNVFFLCRNQDLRKKEELIHYSCMSIYLLRILKHGSYFGDYQDDILTEDELFIGSLILRHLQILQFNAHEVSELQNSTDLAQKSPIMFTNYENATIGAALYPTLALFNHSCDPSIVRYNIKNKIIVRAIKPIKADDIIYENYGPLYMTDTLEKRQEELKNNYWFECLCQPCTDLWPTFQEMKENELRIPCKTDRCPYIFTVKDQDDPFITCPYCNNTTSLIPYLRGLMKLEEILPEAEHQLSMKHFENALKKFVQALEILFKYSRPPHPEIIKIQQRMRICMLHFGNKAFDYKPETQC